MTGKMIVQILTILTIIQTLKFCEHPLGTYRCVNKTVLVNTSCQNEFISIAPGENVMPESLTNDKFYEELSHPHLFPTGKFEFQTKKKSAALTIEIF